MLLSWAPRVGFLVLRFFLLPWVFGEITAPVEKQFGPPTADGKAERAADPLRGDALALLLGDVEEGEVLGAELTCDQAGEVADL